MQEALAQGFSFPRDVEAAALADELVLCFVFQEMAGELAQRPEEARAEQAEEKGRFAGNLEAALLAPALAVCGSQPEQPIRRSWQM